VNPYTDTHRPPYRSLRQDGRAVARQRELVRLGGRPIELGLVPRATRFRRLVDGLRARFGS
jgi:hypothetical protein